MTTTDVFRITPVAYADHLMHLWVRSYRWLLAIPPAVAIGAAFAFDLRFLFVAVILIFLVIPHVMVTVYYYHALSPDSAMSILPHRIVFEPDSLRIIYEDPDEYNEADVEGTAAQPRRPRKDDVIPMSQLRGVSVHKSDILLHLATGKYRIIAVPVSQWPAGIKLPAPAIS